MSHKNLFLVLLSLSLISTLFFFRQEIKCSMFPNGIISIQDAQIKCGASFDKKTFNTVQISDKIGVFHDKNNLYFAYYNGLFYEIQHASPYSIGVFELMGGNILIHQVMGTQTLYYIHTSGGKITDVVSFLVSSGFHYVGAETSSPNLGTYYADENTLYYIYSDHGNPKIQKFPKQYSYSNIDLPPAKQHPNEIFTFADYVIKSGRVYPISNIEIVKNPIMGIEGIGDQYSFVERDFQIFGMDENFVYDKNLNILKGLNPKNTVGIANGSIIIGDGKIFYEIVNGNITHPIPKKLTTTQELINHYNFILKVKNKS